MSDEFDDEDDGDEPTAADDIMDGLVCNICGELFQDIIDGADPPGFERTCDACIEDGEFA